MKKIVLFILSLTTCCFSIHANNYPSKFEGSFEQWNEKRLDLISLFLPTQPVILQAGGHYGSETTTFAHQWYDSQIFSFEPNPHAYEMLFSRSKYFDNMHVYNLALHDQKGIFPFYVCHGSSGQDEAFEHASSLLKPSLSMKVHYQGPIIKVQSVVLDAWCQENKIDHIDFLSLDLQGSELQVLKSSPIILKNLRCLAIHTYFYPFRMGTTQYPELKRFLEESGFRLLSHWYREGLDGDAIFVKNDYFLNTQSQEFLKNHSIDYQYRRFYEPSFNVYYDLDDTQDPIKNILKQGLAYKSHVGKIINDLTKAGSIAIDIGAHIGVHTTTMSKKVGPEGVVFAFEANQKLYMELLNTLAINQCSNVLAISKALGDPEKRVLLNATKIEQENPQTAFGDLVETITLDSFQIQNLSLIKMDVENYEYFVLKGAQETILRNKPVILFECSIGKDYERSDPKEKANFERVIFLIESYGYEIYVIDNHELIAFPTNASKKTEKYKENFRKLDLKR